MSLRYRILLIAGLPTACALVMTGLLIHAKATERREAAVMNRNIVLMQANSQLISEIQKERGRTAQFLSGGKTRNELDQQRTATDAQVPAFLEALDDAAISADAKRDARAIAQTLDQLRSSANAKAPAAQLFNPYCQAIASLIDLHGDLARGKTSRGLGKVMNSVVTLENAKESAGQVRGMLAAVLTQDKPITDEVADKLDFQYASLVVSLASPGLIISADSMQQKQQVYDSSQWKEVAATIRAVRDRRATGGFQRSAEQTFAQLSFITDQIDQMVSRELADASQKTAAYRHEASVTLWGVSLGLGAGLLAMAGLCYWLGRSIIRPIMDMVHRLKDIAQGEGDLTRRVEVTSHDEIGELATWFNTFVKKVHDIVYEVAGATREVASAATQIAASSEEMAQGIAQQTEQTTQVSSAVEQMSSSVMEVARKNADAAVTADDAGRRATEGGRVVEQTVNGMRSIADVVNQSANAINDLGRRGEQIGQVIDVINDIADQTNLLALNAAIEAARAGEHGRGFAVVADEVRKLAERTTRATEEVAESIKAIQLETSAAVQRMGAGTQTVDEGVKLAEQAGDSLHAIVDGSRKVASMIQAIAAAAEQQSAASEQITRNIESIKAVTQQSSEGANQAASAAAHLSTKAEQLQALVGQFKLADR